MRDNMRDNRIVVSNELIELGYTRKSAVRVVQKVDKSESIFTRLEKYFKEDDITSLCLKHTCDLTDLICGTPNKRLEYEGYPLYTMDELLSLDTNFDPKDFVVYLNSKLDDYEYSDYLDNALKVLGFREDYADFTIVVYFNGVYYKVKTNFQYGTVEYGNENVYDVGQEITVIETRERDTLVYKDKKYEICDFKTAAKVVLVDEDFETLDDDLKTVSLGEIFNTEDWKHVILESLYTYTCVSDRYDVVFKYKDNYMLINGFKTENDVDFTYSVLSMEDIELNVVKPVDTKGVNHKGLINILWEHYSGYKDLDGKKVIVTDPIHIKCTTLFEVEELLRELDNQGYSTRNIMFTVESLY